MLFHSKQVVIDHEVLTKIEAEIADKFQNTRDVSTMIAWVKASMQNRDLISIFQVKKHAEDFDTTVMRAMLKGEIEILFFIISI